LDEGWTRWVIDDYATRPFRCLNYRSLEDAEIQAGNLHRNLDVIVIPDQEPLKNLEPRVILNGHHPGTMPPEYTGGLGREGVKALREFVEKGGTLVCLNRASSFAVEQFNLPLRDVIADVPEKEFFVPGSILRIELDTTSDLATGMPKETIAWVEDSPVFELTSPNPKVNGDARGTAGETYLPQARVIARYPTNKNPLLSGWLLGGERMKGKAALVEVKLGQGRVILFGFRPQYRGQSLATYPLFFNAISGK
jgi:hypothetical protein